MSSGITSIDRMFEVKKSNIGKENHIKTRKADSTPRILFTLDFKPRLHRPLEDWLIALAKSFQEQGIEMVAVISAEPVPWFEAEFGKYGRLIVEKKMRNKFSFFALLNILIKEKPKSLCYAFYPMLTWKPLLLTFFPSIRKSYYLDHSSRPIAECKGFIRKLKMIRGKIGSFCYTKITTVSEYNQRKITERLFLNPKKVELIYNGVKLELDDPFPSPRQDVYSANEHPFFLFVGTLSKSKGVHTLIDAYRILNEKISDLPELWLAGIGELETTLKERLEQYALEDKVKLLGLRDDVPTLMEQSRLILIPSEWEEAFGYTVVEAMRSGRPFLVSDAGALPELVSPHGYIFRKGNTNDLAEQMEQLYLRMNHPDTVHRYEALRLRLGERFEFDRMINQYMQVFLENSCF